MKIQIWTGRMGGHARIAEALAWALAAARPTAQVQIVDIYGTDVVDARFSRTTNSYDRLVAQAPWLWAPAFHLSHQRPVLGALRWLLAHLTHPGALRRLVVDAAPDVIVNVICDLGQLSRLEQVARPTPPVVTIVSDLVTLHRGWLSPQAGLVVVPTQAAYDACQRQGVAAERLRLTGYPIRAHLFCRAGEPNGHRLEGGLRVLAMGGASGSGRMIADVRALLDSGLRLSLTVVCGKNARLQRALEALAAEKGGGPRPAQLRVLAYTDDIPDLMRAADVLLTKAGPSTVFEAVASRLPAIITGHLPGQESGNGAFFAREGVALEAPTPADTVRLVRRFVEDPSQLKRLRNPALARETCLAAGRIAELIIATGEGRAPRQPEDTRVVGD